MQRSGLNHRANKQRTCNVMQGYSVRFSSIQMKCLSHKNLANEELSKGIRAINIADNPQPQTTLQQQRAAVN
jgi:hypothetical protein